LMENLYREESKQNKVIFEGESEGDFIDK